MSGKLQVQCKEFKPLERNTLKGFATIYLPAMRLTIHDVAVHEKNGKRWAQLPSKPQVGRDGAVLKDDAGKTKYARILEFDNRDVSDAFSRAVTAAVEDRGFRTDFSGGAAA